MSTCRSCGAEIVWAVTPAGKMMPLDAKPVAGLYAIWPTLDGPYCAPDVGYMNHWATCPSADQHRKAS